MDWGLQGLVVPTQLEADWLQHLMFVSLIPQLFSSMSSLPG